MSAELSATIAEIQAKRAADRKDPARLRTALETALMNLDEAQFQLGILSDGLKDSDGLRESESFVLLYADAGVQQIKSLSAKLVGYAKADVEAGLIAPEAEDV